jgi:hypothetical protein
MATDATDTTSRPSTNADEVDDGSVLADSPREYNSQLYHPLLCFPKVWEWVIDPNDTFNTIGLQSSALHRYSHLFPVVPPKLQHLFSRQYQQQGQNTNMPRFVVDFFNTAVISGDDIDHLTPTPQMLKLRNLKDLYQEIFIKDNRMDGSSLHVRSEQDIAHIVRHPSSMSIVIYGYSIGANNAKANNSTLLKRAIAGITFSSVSTSEIIITMCGTSDVKYDRLFGSGNDNQTFRRRGLMTYLIRMACSIHISIHQKLTTVYSAVYQDDPSRLKYWIKHKFVLHSRSVFDAFHTKMGSIKPWHDVMPCIGSEFLYKTNVGKLLGFRLIDSIIDELTENSFSYKAMTTTQLFAPRNLFVQPTSPISLPLNRWSKTLRTIALAVM